ncbi:MAG: hypothetical protein BWK78_00300 [Thiotrichaceae bacterium IS1]|nr:MAG: hypothetical protein BWK78_00300 [Thiotrichaceae bacterium IS1]
MKLITQEWLNRALEDLETIEQLLHEGRLTNVVSFHAQQAVEKTLKAVIEELEIGFIRTHSLLRLYELVKPHYEVIPDRERLEQLEMVYMESRYPSQISSLPYSKPTIEEAKSFYEFAKRVHEQVNKQLEPR